MAPQAEAGLARLHERMTEEQRQREILSKEEWDAGREARMQAVGEEAGRFPNLLIRAAEARNLLELDPGGLLHHLACRGRAGQWRPSDHRR
ncbi:MAG: hypothetical protein O7A08_06030 [SAR324 cluster bacterium]|nr:hypothetical protein [SAR324 cluster bacterium]